MQDRSIVFVYGSLRKGELHYEGFKQQFGNEIEYLETTTVKGFDLYRLWGYPGIKVGQGTLVVDVLRCGPEAKASMDRMEIGANYSVKPLQVNNYVGEIYLYEGEVQEVNKIDHGDWKKRDK